MSRSKIIVIASLLLICATASWATTSFTCNSGGRTWRITPGSQPIELVMMWTKSGTDCDLLVMDPDSEVFIALGLGIANRYESVKFGALPGIPLTITAIKASGPNSKTVLRGADSGQFLRGRGLRATYLGTMEDLADRDPRYARMLERVRQFQRLKAPIAE